MQEIFEKIIERLEGIVSENIGWNHHKVNALRGAIEIVNQVAEEYNAKECMHNQSLTNADRIRAMSDEELLDFLCSIETYDDGSVKTIEGGIAMCSVSEVEKWLQSEVEE